MAELDSSSYALIMATGINLLIFGILFILFTIYRIYRSKPVRLEIHGRSVPNPPFSESEERLITLLRRVWWTKNSDFANICGPEAHVFLQLHLYMCFYIVLLVLGSWIILVPIYSTCDGDAEMQTDQLSIANCLDEQDKLAASVLLFIIYLGLGYYLGVTFIRQAAISSASSGSQISARTIQVIGLPRQENAHDLNREFKEYWKGVYGDSVVETYVIPDLAEAYRYKLNHEKIEVELEHYKHKSYKQVIFSLRRPIYIQVNFRKVDAVEYYQNRFELQDQEFKEALGKGQQLSSGFGYVQFLHKVNAEEALEKRLPENVSLCTSAWQLTPAPAPQEIIWENLDADPRKTPFIRCILMTLFIFLFLFILTPTSFLNYVGALLTDFGLAEGLFNTYLPTILILIYQTVILPISIEYIVKREKHVNLNNQKLSALNKFLTFMLVYVFIVPLLGMQVYQIIKEIINSNFSSWGQMMADRVTNSGNFFTVFMLSAAFLSNGIDLLQPSMLLKIKIKQMKATSEREQELAYLSPEFNFPLEYAKSMTSLAIILTFSVVYPIILLPGLLYITLRVTTTQYFIQKYKLLFVFITRKGGSSDQIAKNVSKGLFVIYLMFTLLTCFIIMLIGSTAYYTLGSILIFLGIIATFASVNMTERILKLFEKMGAIEYMEYGDMQEAAIGRGEYVHPLELDLHGSFTDLLSTDKV